MFVSHSYNKTLNTDSQKEKLICAFLNSIFLQFVNYFKDGTLPDEEFFSNQNFKKENFLKQISLSIYSNILFAHLHCLILIQHTQLFIFSYMVHVKRLKTIAHSNNMVIFNCWHHVPDRLFFQARFKLYSHWQHCLFTQR